MFTPADAIRSANFPDFVRQHTECSKRSGSRRFKRFTSPFSNPPTSREWTTWRILFGGIRVGWNRSQLAAGSGPLRALRGIIFSEFIAPSTQRPASPLRAGWVYRFTLASFAASARDRPCPDKDV